MTIRVPLFDFPQAFRLSEIRARYLKTTRVQRHRWALPDISESGIVPLHFFVVKLPELYPLKS